MVDGLQQRIYALESKLQAHDIPLRYTVPIRPSQSSTAVSAQRETPSPPPERRVADKHWVPSMGTLVLGRNGGARYIGATAASEWLNEVSYTTIRGLSLICHIENRRFKIRRHPTRPLQPSNSQQLCQLPPGCHPTSWLAVTAKVIT